MKSLLTLIFFFATLNPNVSFTKTNEISSDWTVQDINGKTYNLNEMLEDGKKVMLFFATTWCSYSWDVVESKVLDEIHNTFGPNGTNELVVIFIESDPRTNSDHLNGITMEEDSNYTKGDWVSRHKYPIIDDVTLAKEYQIDAYPTSILVSEDATPLRIMGGTNLTTDIIGKWLENSNHLKKNANENSSCAASDVEVYLAGLDYETVKAELLNYLEKKYSFRTWKNVSKNKMEAFENCENNTCDKIVIQDKGDIIGISLIRTIQDGKNKKSSSLLYVVKQAKDKTKPVFGLQISEYKNATKVLKNGIQVQYKGQCNSHKDNLKDAEKNIEKGKPRVFDNHYIEAYDICSQEPFYSVLSD